MKLSQLLNGQSFKLKSSDNTCIFIKKELQVNQVRVKYFYECVNSGNIIETFNDLEVI